MHKQGYSSFYTTQRYSWSDHREDKVYLNIVSDFEEILNVAIGAVAMYRLAIDPLPIILMDEELMMRSGDFLTRPYSEEFVNKYIGLENIELYKQTEIYQNYKEYLLSQEKQNEAVFDIIHWQIIDRKKFEDISSQMHLLSFMDRLAVVIIMSSTKISQVYIKVASITLLMLRRHIWIRLLVLHIMKISSRIEVITILMFHSKMARIFRELKFAINSLT